MTTRKAFAVFIAATLGISSSLLLLVYLTFAKPVSDFASSEQEQLEALIDESGSLTQPYSITFPTGDWPWYAQNEISVFPEPPVAGQPTELCAEVVNTDPLEPHTAILEFRIAEFGIGMFTIPVGEVEVYVPPQGSARGCTIWIPADSTRVGFEVVLVQEGFGPQISQRFVDMDEPLAPGEPHDLEFPVGNPTDQPITVTLELVTHLPGWGVDIIHDGLSDIGPGDVRSATLTVQPPAGEPLPPDNTIIVDVEAFADGDLIGGFRKIYRPPIRLHRHGDPPYAEREISVHPYPPLAGEPTEVCVELRNPTPFPQDVMVHFAWANFGIGIPFTPINGSRPVHLPPFSIVNECLHWVPPVNGHVCIEVVLEMAGYDPQRSQRNIDVFEPLVPGVPHDLAFPVGNPTDEPITVTMGTIPYLDGWEVTLSESTLTHMTPGESGVVTLTVQPPAGEPLPPDNTIIVDVEAYVDGELLGGFRKIHRPPVPLHPFPDPPYAEREISINPYPPLAGEPTEVCVELRNPTPFPQDVAVQFAWANFGIGIPFTPINGSRSVHLPPFSIVNECLHWVPPVSGHVCIEVTVEMAGYDPQRSQRNIDVFEPLVPGEPHELIFPVGNPTDEPITVTMGTIPYLDGWEVTLSESTLTHMTPGESGVVTLTVQPPAGEPLPPDNTIIVDVEAYVDGELLGGFRKIHRPPVPLHPFPDPPYAEREISINPYPPLAGEPTEVCVELRNPTPFPQDVAVQFAWANFGIGIPFTPINGPRPVHLPPFSIVNECLHWVPPVNGHVCIEVVLEMAGYDPQRSQRNIDVFEPLVPGVPHDLAFPVGNPFDHPITVTMGTIPYLDGWEVILSESTLTHMTPGESGVVTLTVQPPAGEPLPADNTAIVDVEAYVDGELLGGFRKIHRPPVPLHPFPDPPYAEREISINPYPPLAGEPTEVCVELRNPTPFPQDVAVQFAWANFGIGLPFTPINGSRPVHLPPFSIVNECLHWVPAVNGHVCIEVTVEMAGYDPQRSQRNIDVFEPLAPGEPHDLAFPVGNPFDHPITVTMGTIPYLDGWEVILSESTLTHMTPGESGVVTLTVQPPVGEPLPPDNTVIVDVEAYADGELLGGFRKIHRPPVPLHPFPDPPYAEREISINPYPPLAGEPTEVCVELRNPTPFPQDVAVQFAWANFGIGLPFTPINGSRPVHLPPFSIVNECLHWVPPVSGHVCIEVTVDMPGYDPQRSQRNLDVLEPLVPGEPHELIFPVGNPFDHPITVTLGLVQHMPGWSVELSQDMISNLQPGEQQDTVLITTPSGDLPPDGSPVVDVEAFAGGELIGGFRKIYRPPVPIHQPRDPIYAESEIFIHPYPPRSQEPTEIGVEIRNPTDEPAFITVTFSYADFGIGLPFSPIHEPLVVEVPPQGVVHPAIVWIPPRGGLWCIQVELEIPGLDDIFYSQRNIDVGEPLEPEVPHSRVFPVGNPYASPVTITLGLVQYLDGWTLEVEPDILPNMEPEGVRPVTLTVTPPTDLPPDGSPVVDVEAFVDGALLGGFRKLFRPPVPVHRPKDPVYAESEIGVDPYPILPGQPTQLSVEVFNPTDQDRIVTVTFGVAPFGIGLAFTENNITPNPILIFVPAGGAARGHVVWQPPESGGQFCVKVTLEMEGHEPIWSQRNIDVGEPLEPGQSHDLVFPVGNPMTETVTMTLGLINYRDGWDISLSQRTVPNIIPGDVVSVTLTVTPALGAELGTGDPIADVEGYIDGELAGGFRKLDRPPIPLHKPHEKGYAESEIIIEPYPPQQGAETVVSTVVQNTSDQEMTIELAFSWAKFGMGIPFSTTGMIPFTRSLTLSPGITATASISWTPALTGPQCISIDLTDPGEVYEPQVSQRNVEVVERPPCGDTQIFTFTVYNDSLFTQTVDVGLMTFNVPADWQVTTIPSDTLELGPQSELVITVTVIIPCPSTHAALDARLGILEMQNGSGSVPVIDVEGYVVGELVGGVELQFGPAAPDSAIADLVAENDGPTELGQLTMFTATVTAGTNVIYSWDFGDGEAGSGPFVSHLYNAPGDYAAVVTATNSVSELWAETSVLVEEAVAELDAENDGPTALGQLTMFTATVTAGTNVIYSWDFGDGEVGSGPFVSHLYNAPGDYAAVVTATNSVSELWAETSVLVEEAVAELDAENDGPTELGQLTMFTATVTAGTNVIYSWDFGDGEVGSGPFVSHLYNAPGDYTAVVTATNSVSELWAETSVLVEEAVAELDAENDGPTELGQLTMFTATVTAGTNVIYTWDFGDGEVGSGAFVSHLYEEPGIYIASVTATNALGSVSVETVVEVFISVYLPMILNL